MNKKLELGIKAIHFLRNTQGYVRTRDIASVIGAPANFLEQVMRDLRLANLVQVKRGPGGGYASLEDTVTALDIAKAVGRDFGEQKLTADPVDVLNNNIIRAYHNTEV